MFTVCLAALMHKLKRLFSAVEFELKSMKMGAYVDKRTFTFLLSFKNSASHNHHSFFTILST